MHYVGTLDDGTQLDSSRDRQGPLEFALAPCEMIPGFEKTEPSMEQGDTATVAIPAEYAYGPQDAGSMMLAERPSCLRTWISS